MAEANKNAIRDRKNNSHANKIILFEFILTMLINENKISIAPNENTKK